MFTLCGILSLVSLGAFGIPAQASTSGSTTTAPQGGPPSTTSAAPTTTTSAPPASSTTSPPPQSALRRASSTATLNFGSSLAFGSRLVSANGSYFAQVSTTCRLVVLRATDNATLFTSPNNNLSLSCSLSVGSGGDVQIIAPGHSAPVWSAGITNSSYDQLVLSDFGVLFARTFGGIKVWKSTIGLTGSNNSTLGVGQVLRSNQFLLSPNGTFEAKMQSDGNFVTCHSASLQCTTAPPTWSTGTQGNAGAYFTIRRSDSNLVVFDQRNNWKWASFTSGDVGDHLIMQDDGNLGFYGPVGALWGAMNGIIWHFPTSVGVYAYQGPQSNVMADGWGILGITGGLGTTSNPWVDTSSSNDFAAGMAIQNSGRGVPWMSYWTVSGPYTQPTLLGSPCDWRNASSTSDVETKYFWAGLASGVSVAKKIGTYAGQGLHLKPDYVILDPEGYPDYNSGFNCRAGGATSSDTGAFAALVRGWVQGLSAIDPSLRGAFYATQSQFRAFNAAQLRTASGAYIPGFLAVAFGYSGNPNNPLVNPSPISASIPYGASAMANSNIKGVIAFYLGVPISIECSSWTGVAAQAIANWGAPLNTLQFDPGYSCTPSGVIPRLPSG